MQVIVIIFIFSLFVSDGFLSKCLSGKRPLKNLFMAILDKSSQDNQFADSGRLSEQERLQKVIARAGVASRRKAEEMILDGKVTVNGKIVTELGIKVRPTKDLIIVQGRRVQVPDSKGTFWVAINKPKGVLCTREDVEKGRETISDLVPKAKELRLLPIGGLDRDSTGLVIMTNENGWIHPLTHPSFPHRKKYEIVVSGLPTDEALETIRQGLQLPDDNKPCAPCLIDLIDYDKKSNLAMLSLTITESRSQQISRMMEAISCPLVNTKLLQFGPIMLKGLRKGQWREFTGTEIKSLKESCKQSTSAADFAIKSSSRPQKTLSSSSNDYADRSKSREKPSYQKAQAPPVGDTDKVRAVKSPIRRPDTTPAPASRSPSDTGGNRRPYRNAYHSTIATYMTNRSARDREGEGEREPVNAPTTPAAPTSRNEDVEVQRSDRPSFFGRNRGSSSR